MLDILIMLFNKFAQLLEISVLNRHTSHQLLIRLPDKSEKNLFSFAL